MLNLNTKDNECLRLTGIKMSPIFTIMKSTVSPIDTSHRARRIKILPQTIACIILRSPAMRNVGAHLLHCQLPVGFYPLAEIKQEI